MYINKIEIQNIRSISQLEMTFDNNHAGWHVLIGDNGTGKSTVIRAIALALIGANEALGLRQDWESWQREATNENYKEQGYSKLTLIKEINKSNGAFKRNSISSVGVSIGNMNPEFINGHNHFLTVSKIWGINDSVSSDVGIDEGDIEKLSVSFSVAFGPFRRFTGGSSEWENVFKSPSLSKLAAHLSVFGEDVALTEIVGWLINLNYQSLEENTKSIQLLSAIKKLLNEGDLLPNGVKLSKITSGGVFLTGNKSDNLISINHLSDGYRSVLSMTLELIRQMVAFFGNKEVVNSINKYNYINLPGVVLIDEIDAHLHPTWQTKIGGWFLKYFPKIQFIVTTHSPLVCRAAEHGTIWKLSSSDDGNIINQITGTDKNRLVFGNVLDAFETDAFGEDVSRSDASQKKLEKLAQLNMLQTLGKLDKSKEQELQDLKKIFSTDDTFKI